MKDKSTEYLKAIEQWMPKPPDVEKSIIGCCLLDLSDDDWRSVEFLEPEMFYDQQLGELFGIIKKLRSKGETVDVFTVSREVHDPELKRETGMIAASSCYIEHLGYYARVEHQEYLKRSYYTLLHLAPSLFDDSIAIDDFLEKFAEEGKPLFDAIGLREKDRGEVAGSQEPKENEEYKQMLAASAEFVPHYLVKGDEKYKVLMSKFKPYNGYVWINNKAVKEAQMLKQGFEIVYE